MTEALGEIEVCGYNAKITRIWGAVGNVNWDKPDTLSVLIEFVGTQPEGIIATIISIPAKEYTKEELFTVLKNEGDRQVAESIASRRKEIACNDALEQKRQKLHDLAYRTAELLK